MVQNEGHSGGAKKEFEQQPLKIKPSDIKKPGEMAGAKSMKSSQIQSREAPSGHDSAMSNIVADTATQQSETTSVANKSVNVSEHREPKPQVDQFQILQSMMRQHDQQIDMITQSKVRLQEEHSKVKFDYQQL